MKVGLITIYNVPNYGSVLQAFATQTILETLGHECTIINYKYPNEWHFKRGTSKVNGLKKLIQQFGITPFHRKLKRLNHFRNTYYNLSDELPSQEKMKSFDWTEYDAIIVGSDQVWNVRFTKGDEMFLLSFVPNYIPRFSIASSFASKGLPKEFENIFANELKKFTAISVREQNAIELIKKTLHIDKELFVCLDPTLLLNKQEWMNLIPRSNFQKKKPYIIFYLWAYAFEPRPYIFKVLEHFKTKIGDCDVIALEGYTKVSSQNTTKMFNATDASIPEFIDIFMNADLVITSSFHGTAFALNFNVPLISVIPDNMEDDRQLTLLRNVGAENSAVRINDDINKINPFYDTQRVSGCLSSNRAKCFEWIKHNIK